MTKNSLIVNNLPVVSNGSLDDYIKYVYSVPMLTDKEEYALAEKWREKEDVEAARYLVLSHLRLVVSIARTYLGYGLPLSDVIQEGTIGLMKAVRRFDARRNVRLVTFAIHWIKAEINEYVIKNWRIVKTVTTKNQRKLFFNLRSNRDGTGSLSEVEANEIANNLGVSRDEVVDMNMRLTGGDVSILPDNDDDYAPSLWLADEGHSPEEIIAQKAQDKLYGEDLLNAVAILDPRSQDIVRARWLNDPEYQPTLTELAGKYGISAERVRQIEVKALEKMKQYLTKYTDSIDS